MELLTARRRLVRNKTKNLLAICCLLLALGQVSLQQQQSDQLAADEKQEVVSELSARSSSEPLARFKRQSSSSSRASRDRARSHDDEDDNLSHFENADKHGEESDDEPSPSRIRREWAARPVRTHVSASAVASVTPVRGSPASSEQLAASLESTAPGDEDDYSSPREPKESPVRSGLSDKMRKEGWVRYIPVRREDETSKFDSLQKRLDSVQPASDADIGFEQQEQVKTPELEADRAVPKAPAAHRAHFSGARVPDKPKPKAWQRQSEEDSTDGPQREEQQQQQQQEPTVAERPKPKLRKVYADKPTRRPVEAKRQGYRRDTEESAGDCDDRESGPGDYNDFMRLVAAVPMRQIRKMMNKALDSMEASTGLAGADGGRADEREDQDGHYGGSPRARGGSTIAATASIFNSGGDGRGYSREESLVSNNGRTRGIISETRNGRTHTRRVGDRDDDNSDAD